MPEITGTKNVIKRQKHFFEFVLNTRILKLVLCVVRSTRTFWQSIEENSCFIDWITKKKSSHFICIQCGIILTVLLYFVQKFKSIEKQIFRKKNGIQFLCRLLLNQLTACIQCSLKTCFSSIQDINLSVSRFKRRSRFALLFQHCHFSPFLPFLLLNTR